MTTDKQELLCPKCGRKMVYRLDEESSADLQVFKCRSGHLIYYAPRQVWSD